MCVDAHNICPNTNSAALFLVCPMFCRRDELSADSRAAMCFGYNKAPNFRKRFTFQSFNHGNVNPAEESIMFRDNYLMAWIRTKYF